MEKRRVRCQSTGEYGISGEFYRVRKNGRNLYYKNEETYLKMVKDKKIRDQLNNFVSVDILNYDGSQYLPPFFIKRVNELNKLYPMEVILETFKQNKDNLQYWMNQDSKFKNETGRINYMMAIINNNINNEYEKWKERQKAERRMERVNLDASNINLAVEVSRTKRKTKKKSDSISDFL